MKDLSQKVVLITGASSGIGEATARHLAERGAKLMLGARRIDRLERLVDDIRKAGGTAEFRKLDVTAIDSMRAFVTAAQESYGRVDVIVNNAGVMPLSRIEALKIDEWNQMIDVNVRGVLHGIAAALPVMRDQGQGQIINLSSVGGHHVYPTSAVYSATKFAVGAISEGLRQEVDDIRVTVISPGVTESDLAASITDEEAREAMVAFRAGAIPASAIAHSIAYAIEQPDDVDVSEIIVRPTSSPH